MNRKWKEALKNAYKIPEPIHKTEFLRQIRRSEISTCSFMLSQVAYIQKWVIILSVLTFVASVPGGSVLKRDTIWVLSAWMPFIALSAVTQTARSEVYKMAELEMVSRFSLKSVMLARMGIIGLLHLLLLMLLLPLLCYYSAYSIWQVGVYLLVPYLLTTVLGLEAGRRVKDRDSLYVSIGVAFFVSIMNLVMKTLIPLFYQKQLFVWWVIILLFLIIKSVKEYQSMIKQTEELLWNY